MVSAVLAVAAGIFLYFIHITDKFIEKKRQLTLMYEPHPLHRQVLMADQHYVDSSGTTFDIGPHRMRGEAPSLPKDPNVLRIFAVGGSSVFDHQAVPSWPERLGPLLSGERKVESFNGGVPGYSSREALEFYRDRVARFRPDVVILYPGWNDVKYMKKFLEAADVDLYFKWRRDFESQYRFLTEPKPFRNWYAMERMLAERDRETRVRESGVDEPKRRRLSVEDEPTRDWTVTPGIEFFRRNVEDLVDRVRRDGARPVLLVENTMARQDMTPEDRFKTIKYEWVDVGHGDLLAVNEAMVSVMKQVGEKENVPVIDLRHAINGRPEYFTDHVHLTPAGSEALAAALAEALRPLL
jgi:lysophospholipase L1-like esterase